MQFLVTWLLCRAKFVFLTDVPLTPFPLKPISMLTQAVRYPCFPFLKFIASLLTIKLFSLDCIVLFIFRFLQDEAGISRAYVVLHRWRGGRQQTNKPLRPLHRLGRVASPEWLSSRIYLVSNFGWLTPSFLIVLLWSLWSMVRRGLMWTCLMARSPIQSLHRIGMHHRFTLKTLFSLFFYLRCLNMKCIIG